MKCCIIGLGVFGRNLARCLSQLGADVLVVDRKDDKDVLTARLFSATPLTDTLMEKFKKNFRETCTVGIDKLEWVDRKEWDVQTPLIVDQRKWG